MPKKRSKNADVGYGRPPKASRWKPGQSGNPSSKKKGTKNSATILQEIMQRRVSISDHGTAREITVHEGLYLAQVALGLEGDLKAATFLLAEYAATQSAAAARQANQVEIPPVTERLKRVIASTALGVGGIASVIWLLFLGWAVSEVLVVKTLRKWSQPSFPSVAAARPQQSKTAYRQPSSLVRKLPEHP